MTRKKLLLVEDDRALAELLIWHFEREDYEVRRTGDGEEALLLASEDAPDVIILDWMIEGILGLEVCRRLRRRSETANVPIIMLTARGEESDRIRGLETGADDYVTKPFSPRELVARVGAVLRRVRPALAAEQLGYGRYFINDNGDAITDDHLPLQKKGLRVIDVIDIQYGPLSSKSPTARAYPNYHHTMQDTFDKVSPKSLQIVGDVALTLVK